MPGSFDVKLEETVYMPDPSIREQSWIGDYDTEEAAAWKLKTLKEQGFTGFVTRIP